MLTEELMHDGSVIAEQDPGARVGNSSMMSGYRTDAGFDSTDDEMPDAAASNDTVATSEVGSDQETFPRRRPRAARGLVSMAVSKRGNGKASKVVKMAQGLRQTALLRRDHARESTKKKCCKKLCCKHFSVQEVLSVREPYWGNDGHQDQRDEYLKALLAQRKEHTINDGGRGYTLLGKQLCSKGIIAILAISSDTLYRMVKVAVHGQAEAAYRGNAWKNRVGFGKKKSLAVGWMETYTSLRGSIGDWQPDKLELHLAYLQKSQIYHTYVADMLLINEVPCERSYFGRLFTHHFPHVRVHKWKNFSKCSTCSHWDKALMKAKDRFSVKTIRAELDRHLAVVFDQKQKHWKHVYKAKRAPALYFCSSHDGMDTYKCTVCHYSMCPKDMSGLCVMCMHVMGVLTHAHSPYAFAYVSPPGVGTGACLGIEVLSRVLIKQKKENGFVPPVWYIQADNTAAEFKNSVSFMWLGLLVQIGLFTKVCLYFVLPLSFLFVRDSCLS
jgi:hypothetical protein